MTAAADRHLLFGLVALQNGIINQDQLLAAFRAWTLDKARALADHLVDRGDLDLSDRRAVDVLVSRHINKHGGDVEKSLAAFPAGPATRESLAHIGDPDVDGTLARLGATSTQRDADRTASYEVGTAASDGQRFRVLRPHARGGLGAVFVALDTELHREVALKQMLDHHANDPTSRQRFVIEAEITGGLEHPGIVPVYSLGTYPDGRPFYAMRFIKGDSLKEAIEQFHGNGKTPGANAILLAATDGEPGRKSAGSRSIRTRGADATPLAANGGAPGRVSAGSRAIKTRGADASPLALRKLLRRFLDVCNAIDYAHSRGVLHRDIKPANIIVGKYGETLLVDWGLAKATGRSEPGAGERTLLPSSSSGSSETLPGSALGTPAYMSPEQAEGDLDQIGARSDVYGLGATLYCLLTGRPPFAGDDPGAILRSVQRGQFLPPRKVDPSIDKALEAVCLKAMALDPGDRYSTPKSLADDIERWMADEPVAAWREPILRRLSRWGRRNRTVVMTATAAVLVALVGTAAVLAVQTRANRQLNQANFELKASNAALAAANTQVRQANAELTEANQRVVARFELALEAIQLFHGEVSADLLLKEKQFDVLRTKLLHGAADFYRRLEGLLKPQADRASRAALGRAYQALGEVTGAIGSKPEALTIHRQALVVRRTLAAEAGSDAPITRDVARSLLDVGDLLKATGDTSGALSSFQESREICESLARDHPAVTDFQFDLAKSYNNIGRLLSETGKPVGALEAYGKAQVIHEALALANPAVTQFQHNQATSYNSLATLLKKIGKSAEALAAFGKAQAIQEALARANPAVTRFQIGLARIHNNIGSVQHETGKLAGALAAYGKAHVILDTLARAHPSVTDFQFSLAVSRYNIGIVLTQTGQLTGALEAYGKARPILQKLVDANPTVIQFPRILAAADNNSGDVLAELGRTLGAMAFYEKALAMQERLIAENPSFIQVLGDTAESHYDIGRLLSRTGQHALALASLEKARVMQEKLVAAYPAFSEFRAYLALTYNAIGVLRFQAGETAAALAALDRARTIRQKLSKAAPEVSSYRDDLAGSLTSLGDVFRATGRTAEARAAYERAIAIREALVQTDPEAVAYRSGLASSLRRLALTQPPADAAASWRRAIALYENLPILSVTDRFDLACCHAALSGTAGRAGSGMSAAEATSEADRAIGLLRRAIADGERNTAALRVEAALDPLRERPDFKLLVMNLAIPAAPFAGGR